MNQFEKSGRRIVLGLFLSGSFTSASFIMAFTIGSIAVVELAGDNSQWTGVPSTVVQIGAALIVYPIGRLMDRFGRRVGLSLGHIIGLSGALVAGWALVAHSLVLFLAGVLMMGMARGVSTMGRYAAAEASHLNRRARAISLVVLGGTVGSVVGPSLLELANDLGQRAGLPELSGPWFAAAVLFAVALLVINITMRPDPQVIARQLATLAHDRPTYDETRRNLREITQDPRTVLAIGAMVFGQLAMVAVMTVTPIHMHGHEHAIGAISYVIMAHTLGMFGLSFVTGWLVDTYGRTGIIAVGSLVLIVACLIAPLSTTAIWLAVALFLLGLGWNFCFVGGSTLLDDVLRPQEKGRVQGLTEAMISVASGMGSISSGLIFSAIGFTFMGWGTILIAAVPVLLAVFSKSRQAQKPRAYTPA